MCFFAIIGSGNRKHFPRQQTVFSAQHRCIATIDKHRKCTSMPKLQSFEAGKQRACAVVLYLHELADLGADRFIVVVGAFDEDSVTQLCSPPASRAEDLTRRSNEEQVSGVAAGQDCCCLTSSPSKTSLTWIKPMRVHRREHHRGRNKLFLRPHTRRLCRENEQEHDS